MILDASVVVKLVAAEPGTVEAREVCFAQPQLLAPDWVLLETGSALWGKVMRGELLAVNLPTLMRALPEFFESFAPATELIEDALELAVRLRHHVYDCLYLALALRERQPLLTADREFVRSARSAGLGDNVDLLTWPGI